MATTYKTIKCTFKKPVLLKIGDLRNFNSGVSIIDITLSDAQSVDLRDISFKNNYTAYLTVKLKCKPPESKQNQAAFTGDLKWKTCVRMHQLMPDPHCEPGSQQYFVISKKQMLFDPSGVVAVRLTLRQPSPTWLQFGIDDIILHQNTFEAPSPTNFPSWLLEREKLATSKEEISGTALQGVFQTEKIAKSLQKLWALTESVSATQTASSLGRYDINDCYEINLLSYT